MTPGSSDVVFCNVSAQMKWECLDNNDSALKIACKYLQLNRKPGSQGVVSGEHAHHVCSNTGNDIDSKWGLEAKTLKRSFSFLFIIFTRHQKD